VAGGYQYVAHAAPSVSSCLGASAAESGDLAGNGSILYEKQLSCMREEEILFP
jgi:hypothetical protein